MVKCQGECPLAGVRRLDRIDSDRRVAAYFVAELLTNELGGVPASGRESKARHAVILIA